MTSPRLCRDCDHHRTKGYIGLVCAHPAWRDWQEPVMGCLPYRVTEPPCEVARAAGLLCGMEGRLWETT